MMQGAARISGPQGAQGAFPPVAASRAGGGTVWTAWRTILKLRETTNRRLSALFDFKTMGRGLAQL